jgi:hypothetical protein
MGGPLGVTETPAAIVTNDSEDGRFGAVLSGADADGDGFEDLGVGAMLAPEANGTQGPGKAYLFSGSRPGIAPNASASFTGTGGSWSGFAISLTMSASGS